MPWNGLAHFCMWILISTRVYIPQNKIHKYQRYISVEYRKTYAWVLTSHVFRHAESIYIPFAQFFGLNPFVSCNFHLIDMTYAWDISAG